ncbi:MOSC domain-containing protein [Pseudalkalibacillus hwajinpoensis]|uniref:MOSC domain-containing protein n=1 Tax=Guptibacillus hwajinpoensis TaxID=208199 RepID=A0A4U1MPE5_9BACL|nr:MOSC domain-containing protein [Pseudalkalibacillus hwajinpoensis]TKD72552.1 MOSC domain-containing protein [Pseudalkalibacillus hwajinpoensis]
MEVGIIKEMTRHPVKSMTGEKVQRTKVMPYGLYGDRSHALLDEKESFLTITQFAELVQYQASFSGPESLEAYPEPQIVTPNGQTYMWSDSEWLKDIERSSSRLLARKSYHPEHVPIGPIEEEHLLLVTDASLQSLSHSWGKEIDDRRFRPNLVISLFEKTPFVEKEWEGKFLRIGQEVMIEVVKPCERCMIITVDPEDGTKQPGLLKKLVKEQNNLFGMYARVKQTGEITTGDRVFITEQ